MNVMPVSVYVGIPHACFMPMEVKRGHWIP